MTGIEIELQERDLAILAYLYNTKAATNAEIAQYFSLVQYFRLRV